MERKSIGSFIAALRKAKGLTQRQLAELLNVSDKAVSRWERDECAPDLSLIPVIAEIFGVTCDELLRGERAACADGSGVASGAGAAKGPKQLKHLLRRQLTDFQNRSLIAVGIAAAGLVTALICNFCFYRAALGGLLSLFFYGAAAICEAIFLNQSALNEEDGEAFDAELLTDYRVRRINCAKLVYLLIVVLAAVCFPLLWLPDFTGLPFGWGLLLCVLGLAGSAALLFAGVWRYGVQPSLLRRGSLPESGMKAGLFSAAGQKRRKWIKKRLLIDGGLLAATVLALLVWHIGIQPENLANAIAFEDFDSFTAFMELPVMADGDVAVLPAETDTEDADSDGRPEQITDREGNVLCEYYQRNHSVVYVSFHDDDSLPIQVITRDALRDAAALHQTVYTCLGWLTVIELIAGILIVGVGVRKKEK